MTMTVGIVNLGNRSGDVLTVNERKLMRGEYTTMTLIDAEHAEYQESSEPGQGSPGQVTKGYDEWVGEPQLLVADRPKTTSS